MISFIKQELKNLFLLAIVFCSASGCVQQLKNENLMISENFDENIEFYIKDMSENKTLIVISLGIINPDINQENLTFEFVGLERLGTRFQTLESKDEFTWNVINDLIEIDEERVYLFYIVEPFEKIQIKDGEHLIQSGKMQLISPIQIKVSDGKGELFFTPGVISTLA